MMSSNLSSAILKHMFILSPMSLTSSNFTVRFFLMGLTTYWTTSTGATTLTDYLSGTVSYF